VGLSFQSSQDSISVAAPAPVYLDLDVGPARVGRIYIILGSVSGTSPGFMLPGGVILPLNYDLFTNYVLNNLNTAFFVDFLGNLDGKGTAQATLNLVPPPDAIGFVLYFAFALGRPFDFASYPLSVEIVP
jgi:hypothetical protein